MPVAEKNREAIINAIRVLRSRRVRPSGQKISWYLKRQHYMDEEATEEALNGMVRSCDILRVEYKGALSYRVAKSRSSKSISKTPPLDGHSVRRAILSAVAYCGTSGGSRHRVVACLRNRGLDKLIGRLDVILQREVRIGVLTKKPGTSDDGQTVSIYATSRRSRDTPGEDKSSSSDTDNPEDADDEKTQAPFEHLQQQLKLLQKQKNGKRSRDVNPCDAGNNKTTNENEYNSLIGDVSIDSINKPSKRGRPRKCITEVIKEVTPKRKGRPPSKRAKKEKKVYDPSTNGRCKRGSNEVSSAEVSPGPINKCSVCNTNERDVLCCNICTTKVHPKCVGYSEELAIKILNFPWTCMDCKSCSICKYNHSIGALIFCDKCDRGFHQTCHHPPVADLPNGAWICFICLPREKEKNVYESLIPWLPTPVSSPDRDEENSSGYFEPAEVVVPNAADWSVALVAEYFQKNGFEQYIDILKEQEIDGCALLILTRDDVVYGFGLKLGPALRLFRQIRILQTRMPNPQF